MSNIQLTTVEVAEIKERIGPFMLVRVLTGVAIFRTDRFGNQEGGKVGHIPGDGGPIEWNEGV